MPGTKQKRPELLAKLRTGYYKGLHAYKSLLDESDHTNSYAIKSRKSSTLVAEMSIDRET